MSSYLKWHPNLTITSQQTFVGLQDMSWRRLQHVFSVTILRLPRRLEDVLRRRLEDVLKTFSRPLARRLEGIFKMSSRRLGRRKIVTLKTSSRRLEDMSWRRLEGISWRRLQDVSEANKSNLYLTNLNVYLTNLCLNLWIFNKLYLRNLRRIQNVSLRTQ